MNTTEFLSNVKSHALDYTSLPFWSWNDRLKEDELRRQIGVMQSLGMNGFFMHPRGGLETEYLSDEWFDCVRVCIDEAKKRGMTAWCYDENGWPSGFAGGKLLEDEANFALFLRHEKTNVYPSDMTNVLGVYILENGKIKKITSPVDNAEYHIIRRGQDSSYVDTLDGRITAKFIEATHEEYRKRLPAEDLGTHMPGFFTDEPQYYRWATVWSDTIPEKFAAAYGYSVYDYLPALFCDEDLDGAKEFRYDYWKLCHRLFIENWIKPIYEWAEKNGCQITGHAVEEASLSGQMWCCGGIMPFYEYEHIPGIDYLGRGLGDDAAPKQLGSVCAQLGKKKALSEMFGCCGWDVTPTELKAIAELQYSSGVNVMCQHLYAYSIRGQRKRDYPANYSEHLPWQPHMKEFDSYFNNLGCILAQGEEEATTLVIHPIHSAYLSYQRERDYQSIKPLEDAFHALSNKLAENHIPYHWGDEDIMSRHAKTKDGKITVGNCTYSYIIVPSFDTIDASTAELLQKYIKEGGKIWLYGDKPTRIDGRKADLSWLTSTTTFEEIAASGTSKIESPARINQMVRHTPAGTLIYAVNLSGKRAENVKFEVKNVKSLIEIDVATLTPTPVQRTTADGNFTFTADFDKAQSRVYLSTTDEYTSPAEAQKSASTAKIRLENNFTLTKKAENQLTLDKFALSTDGGKTFSDPKPIECIRDNLLRRKFKGRAALRASFTVDEIPTELKIAVEPFHNAEYYINGRKFTLSDSDTEWWLDRGIKTADILPYTTVGNNEITVTFDYYQRDYVYYVLYGGVSESLRNCLSFDTELECMYLTGDFRVNTPGEFADGPRLSTVYSGPFSVAKQKPEIDLTNITKDGFPFFAGTIEAETALDYTPGSPTELELPGRYAVCEVRVNDSRAATLMFTDHCDLSACLRPGKNKITLRLTNSNRNLLGPHHGHDPEPYAVGPRTFSMEKQWHGDKCNAYVPTYAFVRFGIDAK